MVEYTMTTTSRSEAMDPPSLPKDHNILPQLKFLIGNIKSTFQTSLLVDNHQIWRSQILKLFRPNGYDGFLTGKSKFPPKFLDGADVTQSILYKVESDRSKSYAYFV